MIRGADQVKLLNAGFRLFRQDVTRLVITEATRAGGWSVHSRHESIAAGSRAWKELMKDPKNIHG